MTETARRRQRMEAAAARATYENMVTRVRAGDWGGIRLLELDRVSDDDDLKGGRSIIEQGEKTASVRAAHPGSVIVARYIDAGIGASIKSTGIRYGYERLLADVTAGKGDMIVVWASDRAHRKMSDFVTLRDLCIEKGVMWYYRDRALDLRNSQADRDTALMDAWMAERGALDISVNVSRAITTNAASGRPHGRQLYGYTRTYDPPTGKLLTVEENPGQAAIVREIFRRFTSGENTNQIAKDLNERKITPTDRRRVQCPVCEKLTTWRADNAEPGKVTVGRHHPPESGDYCTGVGQITAGPADPYWDPNMVTRILRNESYAGQRTNYLAYTPQKPVTAIWTGLVDENTFLSAQEILDDPERLNHKVLDGKARYLLTGRRGLCGVCGSHLRCVKNKDGRLVYECAGRGDRSLGAFCTTIPVADLDAAVTAALIRRMRQPDGLATLAGDTEERTRKADAEVLRINKALTEYQADAKKGKRGLGDIIDSLERDLEQALRDARPLPVPDFMKEFAEDPAAFWEAASGSLPLRRAVLKWTVTPYLYPAGTPGGRAGLDWRNGAEREMIVIDVQQDRSKRERTCGTCGRAFMGHGKYCPDGGCYPSQSPEARQAAYEATKDEVLATRKAERAAAGPGPRAQRRAEVVALLTGDADLSDLEIAAQTGVSRTGVWKIRRQTPGARESRTWRGEQSA